ncbi:MAG: homoserine dehydrogenase [Acidimicrobiales bacterium]
MQQTRTIRIGLLGCGTVGSSFCQLIAEESDEIERRLGVRLEVTAVAVRDTSKTRTGVDPSIVVDDPAAVVAAENTDLVVEVMGGVDPTRSLVLDALAAGKPVVTANKELLALHGPELYAAADGAGVDLAFEAAVAAGIPLIRPLRESLVGEKITQVLGILNGTTNYILSQMTEHGAGYTDALAEADPTADVGGFDAGSKVAIIATLAFGEAVMAGDVHIEGITTITTEDIAHAARLGYVIKLLGVVERGADGAIGARVHPTMVPTDHPLASVRDSFNAVFVEGAGIDQLMFYGRGAGGHPTAAMMVGDTIDAARNLVANTHSSLGSLPRASVRPVDEVRSAFFVSLDARDEPGVLAAIASVFGDLGVSIRSMEQEGMGDQARLVFITHKAREADLRATLAKLSGLDVVKDVGQVLRVIGN